MGEDSRCFEPQRSAERSPSPCTSGGVLAGIRKAVDCFHKPLYFTGVCYREGLLLEGEGDFLDGIGVKVIQLRGMPFHQTVVLPQKVNSLRSAHGSARRQDRAGQVLVYKDQIIHRPGHSFFCVGVDLSGVCLIVQGIVGRAWPQWGQKARSPSPFGRDFPQ